MTNDVLLRDVISYRSDFIGDFFHVFTRDALHGILLCFLNDIAG